MRKTVVSLIVASLVSATSVGTAVAGGVEGMSIFNPFWPVATALSIPASIIGNVVSPGSNVPIVVPTVPNPAPVVYSPPEPVVYREPATYYVSRPYYAPRVYVEPRYYAPRAYYPPRVYRVYRSGW